MVAMSFPWLRRCMRHDWAERPWSVAAVARDWLEPVRKEQPASGSVISRPRWSHVTDNRRHPIELPHPFPNPIHPSSHKLKLYHPSTTCVAVGCHQVFTHLYLRIDQAAPSP